MMKLQQSELMVQGLKFPPVSKNKVVSKKSIKMTSSSSNQRVVQSYLERHHVGQLFEEMMAKLIKDMPNEPIPYLLKFLQIVYQNKNEYVESTLPQTSYKGDMGLIGSSIPKKYSKDPQVILPGSKPVISTWANVDDGNSVMSEDMKTTKSRSYAKPWLSGAKVAKSKEKRGVKADEGISWNNEGKVTSKSFDDIFNQQNDSHPNPLSKSQPIGLNSKPKALKENNWADTKQHTDKENIMPESNRPPSRITNKEDDELKIESNGSKTKKLTISPSTYSKFKKQNSKKKSQAQKQKLQALLSNGSQQPKNSTSANESTDDENEVEVLESQSDLAGEGVKSKRTSGIKRSILKSSASTNEVRVSVCSTCAKLLGSNSADKTQRAWTDRDAFLKSTTKVTYADQSDDDDFESVSQINNNRPYRPKWPVISDSEGDDQMENETAKLSLREPRSSSTHNKLFDSEKSDFFERNSPSRKKVKPSSTNIMGDNEPDIFISSKTSPLLLTGPKSPSKQAWRQIPDTGSEADLEEEDLEDGLLKSRGWKQKIGFSDDASTTL